MTKDLWRLVVFLMMSAISWAANAQNCSEIARPLSLPAPNGSASRLAIVLHGMKGSAADIKSVGEAIQRAPAYDDTDVEIPQLPFSTFSSADPGDVLACLLQLVNAKWQEKKASGKPYQSVLLVGHSMGSLFVRKLYVVARGELPAAPFEPELKRSIARLDLSPDLGTPQQWFPFVERIVLLAAINRGWSVNHHMPFERMAVMQGGLALNRVAQAAHMPAFTVMATRRGAPFVTQLRLQWLAMMECAQKPSSRRDQTVSEKELDQRHRSPVMQGDDVLLGLSADTESENCKKSTAITLAPVVQLLGTEDDLIPPSDNIDAVAGRRFTYLQVPHSNHGNVIKMGSADENSRAREKAFYRALDPEDEGDLPPELISARADPDYDVKHVVFVMHGIRDEGFWTERLGAAVRAKLQKLPDCAGNVRCKVRLEVSSYGYFPMLSFLKPGSRNEKVEWLMDRYTEAKAQYPAAKFYYIGHSHGTYLLKEALENYDAVKFKRVVLAGSVLKSDHDWPALIQAKRVDAVLNLSATEDWVVAFFPNALQMMHLQDLGGAGFYGFNKQAPGITQIAGKTWVVGRHDAAVKEDWWEPVADFVATGALPTLATKLTSDKQEWWVKAGGAIAPLLWLLIATILAGGAWLIFRSGLREWVKTAALLGYTGSIWFVLTTV
jgi:hypothetical protein